MKKHILVLLLIVFLASFSFAGNIYDYCGGNTFFSVSEEISDYNYNVSVYMAQSDGTKEFIYKKEGLVYSSYIDRHFIRSCCGEDYYFIIKDSVNGDKVFKVLKNSSVINEIFPLNKFYDSNYILDQISIAACISSDQYFDLTLKKEVGRRTSRGKIIIDYNYFNFFGKSFEGSSYFGINEIPDGFDFSSVVYNYGGVGSDFDYYENMDLGVPKEGDKVFSTGGDIYFSLDSKLYKSVQKGNEFEDISSTIYRPDGSIWQTQDSFDYNFKIVNRRGGFNDAYFINSLGLFKSIEGDLNLYYLGNFTSGVDLSRAAYDDYEKIGYFGFDDFYYSCDLDFDSPAVCKSFGGDSNSYLVHIGANFNQDYTGFQFNSNSNNAYLFLKNDVGAATLIKSYEMPPDIQMLSRKEDYLYANEVIFENLIIPGDPHFEMGDIMPEMIINSEQDDILFFNSGRDWLCYPSCSHYFYDSRIKPNQLIKYELMDFFGETFEGYSYHPKFLIDYTYDTVNSDYSDRNFYAGSNRNPIFNFVPNNFYYFPLINDLYYNRSNNQFYFRNLRSSYFLNINEYFYTMEGHCQNMFFRTKKTTGENFTDYVIVNKINNLGQIINLGEIIDMKNNNPFFCGGDAYFIKCDSTQENCELRKNPELNNQVVLLDGNYVKDKGFCLEGSYVWFNKNNELNISSESSIEKTILSNKVNSIFFKEYNEDFTKTFVKGEIIFSGKWINDVYDNALYKVIPNQINPPTLIKLSDKARGIGYCGDEFYWSDGIISNLVGELFKSKIGSDTNSQIYYYTKTSGLLDSVLIDYEKTIDDSICGGSLTNVSLKNLDYFFTFYNSVGQKFFSQINSNKAYFNENAWGNHEEETTMVINPTNSSDWLDISSYSNDTFLNFCSIGTRYFSESAGYIDGVDTFYLDECIRPYIVPSLTENMSLPKSFNFEFIHDSLITTGPLIGKLMEYPFLDYYTYDHYYVRDDYAEICYYVCDYGYYKVGEKCYKNPTVLCAQEDKFCLINSDCCSNNCEDNYCVGILLDCGEDDWCNPDCVYDPDCETTPAVCGNGIIEEGEQCGEPGLNCAEGFECNNCECIKIPVIKNSINSFTGQIKDNIELELLCKQSTNGAVIKIFNADELIETYDGILCSDTKQKIIFEKNLDFEKIYDFRLTIPQECDVCYKSIFLIKEKPQGDLSIPDNNFLIVLIFLIMTIVLIKTKKINFN